MEGELEPAKLFRYALVPYCVRSARDNLEKLTNRPLPLVFVSQLVGYTARKHFSGPPSETAPRSLRDSASQGYRLSASCLGIGATEPRRPTPTAVTAIRFRAKTRHSLYTVTR